MNIPAEIVSQLGGAKPRFEDQFIYTASLASLAPGVSGTDNIQIQADSYFVVTKMSYFAAIGSATQTESSRVIPLISVMISDTGSGRNLMDSSVNISSMAGHEGLPFITPTERWMLPSSVLNIQFTNFDAVTTYTDIKLYLHGIKIWF